MGKDTLSEIVTSIRNADMAKKETVRITFTNIAQNIVTILLREGFIKNAREHRESKKSFLVLTLRHRRNRKGPSRTLFNLKRVSRPGLRIYSNYQKFLGFWAGWGLQFFLLLKV